jgi:hypothetical protein
MADRLKIYFYGGRKRTVFHVHLHFAPPPHLHSNYASNQTLNRRQRRLGADVPGRTYLLPWVLVPGRQLFSQNIKLLWTRVRFKHKKHPHWRARGGEKQTSKCQARKIIPVLEHGNSTFVNRNNTGFEVVTAVTTNSSSFQDISQSIPINFNQCFEGTYYLHFLYQSVSQEGKPSLTLIP